MARNIQINIKLSYEEMNVLNKITEKTKMSRANVIMEGLEFLAANNLKLEKLEKDIKSINKIRRIKDFERQSGDYIGSFDKLQNKIDDIKATPISEEEKEFLIERTKRNYRKTQKTYKKIFAKEKLKIKKKQDRKKFFKNVKKRRN